MENLRLILRQKLVNLATVLVQEMSEAKPRNLDLKKGILEYLDTVESATIQQISSAVNDSYDKVRATLWRLEVKKLVLKSKTSSDKRVVRFSLSDKRADSSIKDRIVSFIRERGSASRATIMSELKLKPSTTSFYLWALKRDGLIKLESRGKEYHV